MNRREVLKYFGVGAAITALDAGPIVTLIEPPKVELATVLPQEEPIVLKEVQSVTIICEMADGSHRTVRGGITHASGTWRGPQRLLTIDSPEALSPYVQGGLLQASCLIL
jgi:hypothetical protein